MSVMGRLAGPASTVISTVVAASMLSVSAAHAASLYVVDDTSASCSDTGAAMVQNGCAGVPAPVSEHEAEVSSTT